MYGTVMIARTSVTPEEFRAAGEKWTAERGNVPGYMDQWVMHADDGRVVLAVRFASKEAYLALADDPVQSKWYESVMAPMLDGDPEWIDGHWADPI